jgi:hypothetical protein
MYNHVKAQTDDTLGNKLKKTLDELEDAKIKNIGDQANADLEKIRKAKQEKTDLINKIKEKFVEQIENNKVPYTKITDYTLQEWIRSAQKRNAEFQEIWDYFVGYFKNEKCAVMVKEEHDGQGMANWIVLTLVPQLNATRVENYFRT